MWNGNRCNRECNKACNSDDYLNIKNFSYKKHLFDKLVLGCEDEIVNTCETSVIDKKVTCKKNNYLIHTISLVIIKNWYLLLLFVICISFYYYYYIPFTLTFN